MTWRAQRKPLPVIARRARAAAIQSCFAAPGLLRGACHRARVRATRWLAMTLRVLRKPLPTIARRARALALASPLKGKPMTVSTNETDQTKINRAIQQLEQGRLNVSG